MSWEIELAENAPDKEIADKVIAAVRSLLASDKHLLQVDANERSISHRLALYLTLQFAGFDVDCEYNRDHHKTKRLLPRRPCACSADTEDTDGSPVLPDIIVHRRGTKENILVIEIKKSTNSKVSDNCDQEKLCAFREELGYKNALFLRFKCGVDNPTVSNLKWIGSSGNDAQ